MTKRLLLVLVVTTTAAGGKVAALDTAWTATTEWGGHSELNVRLGLDTHHEGWDVDNLAANTAGGRNGEENILLQCREHLSKGGTT